MKHNSILSLFIFLMGLGVATTSCEDMLTPDMDRYSEGFSGTDTVYFYHGILANVQDMVEQNQLLGDLRSDLVTSTKWAKDSVSHIIDYDFDADGDNALMNRAAYYKVINQCNFYLAKVDTMAQKNKNYYMRREFAQVVNIRAWAYLQLVHTYGRVPFFTDPVDNADTGWETNPPAWATADNLVDLLKDGLQQAEVYESTLGYPSYNDYSTGQGTFDDKFMRFYSNLIMGDLYLLRGATQADYKNAARYYYTFLNEKCINSQVVSSASCSFTKNTDPYDATNVTYTPQLGSWVSTGLAAGVASLNNAENITCIPSAANKTLGRMMTQVAQICGFDPSSRSTGDGTGTLSVTRNYKSRQIEPSNSYLNLNAAQVYSVPQVTNDILNSIEYYNGAGDARLYGTAPLFKDNEEKDAHYIVKDAPVSDIQGLEGYGRDATFKQYKSLYRLKQIYLRYAEALNRAGYPRLAFMVLRDGLDYRTIPTLADSVKYDDVAQTKQTVYYMDSTSVLTAQQPYAAYYIGVDELRRLYADGDRNTCFGYISASSSSSDKEYETKQNWTNAGIHEAGCGASCVKDSIFDYNVVVAQRIQDEALRSGGLTADAQDAIKKLRRADEDQSANDETVDEGDTEEPEETLEERRERYTEIPAVAAEQPTEEEINAVETLIADEMALETAFEGTRMFDLIRMARHKNLSALGGDYGTKWLAWKIARRNENLAPYEQPRQFDGTLYNKLLDTNNWYIPSPEYK